ncbi:efflux transporter outer membrane subunit [bacterium]|nr:efflux transporter outer membrane subunit [bacterium]
MRAQHLQTVFSKPGTFKRCLTMIQSRGVLAFLLTVALFATGCAGWRGVREPDVEPPPEQFIQAEQTANYSDEPWWPAFGDTTLNRLMDEAFSSNLTLQQQAARLQQTRHALAMARASWFPSLNVSGSFTEYDFVGDPLGETGGGQGGQGGQSGGGEAQPSQFGLFIFPWEGSLSASYEVDLWGKLNAGRQAAWADLIASEEDLRALTLTMSAQVARSYYRVVELKQQLELVQRTIDSYNDYKQLVTERYNRGVSSSADLYQAETNLTAALSQREQLKGLYAQAQHALSVLLGRYPQTDMLGDAIELPAEVEQTPVGLPSELIRRRPDVRASYARMIAADRRAAEAVANMYPKISLTGTVSARSDDVEGLFDPDRMIWMFISNLSAPLFQGGRLRANKNMNEAAWDAAMIGYRQTMLSAYRDVEDALVTGRTQVNYVAALKRQAEAAAGNLRIATDRYMQGITNYLPVVLAQTSYFNVQRSLITARRGLVDARIQLAVALGGGWTNDTIETHLAEKPLHKEMKDE